MNAGRVIVHGDEFLSIVRAVASDVALVAGSTMGPFGHTVIMGKEFTGAKPTKDGVTAVKDMKYRNKSKQALLSLIQEAAGTVNQLAGDGTTTVTILICALLEALGPCIAGGIQPLKLKTGLERAKLEFLEYIRSVSRPVCKKQEMYNVAKISSNGDEDIAEVLAEIIEKVGRNGVITIDEGKTLKKVDHELMTGMCFSQGYISSYFVTNNEKMIAELDNPYILIMNKKISSIQQILPVLESTAQAGKALLIISEDVEGEALATLIFNKIRGGLKVCAVKAPGFGERRFAMLEDIAILSGGQLIVDELGLKPDQITLNMLGTAKRVTIQKDKTIIVGGSGSKADIDSRVELIKGAIEESTSDYDKEKLRERIARLVGGVAVIKVGGATESEVKERKDRYEDALNATRAAVEEGIVLGGGIALCNAYGAMSKAQPADDGERMGFNMALGALSACMSRILHNAGFNGPVIASKLADLNDSSQIFDARNGKFVNAFDAGIIDPAKVVRVAFETAISTVSLIIGTRVLLVDEESDNGSGNGAKRAGAGGGMGDMDF